MAKVSTYLNFADQTEKAFNFYKSVFGGEFSGLQRFSEVEDFPGKEKMSKQDLNLIMHMSLPIMGGHHLMGSDAPEGMGFNLKVGNNVNISLHPDSREEADQLFEKLSQGGEIEMPMQDMFWGDYYGSFVDKYGIKWMINYSENG